VDFVIHAYANLPVGHINNIVGYNLSPSVLAESFAQNCVKLLTVMFFCCSSWILDFL